VDEPLYDYAVRAGSLSADRVASLWSRVQLLEKAERNTTLTDAERSELRASLREHRVQAAHAEIHAVRAGERSRGDLLRLARRRRRGDGLCSARRCAGDGRRRAARRRLSFMGVTGT
jgi:hypothetical protein